MEEIEVASSALQCNNGRKLTRLKWSWAHGLAARCNALPWSAFLKLSASSEAVGGGLGTATVDMAADPSTAMAVKRCAASM